MGEETGTTRPEDTGHRLRLLGRERQFEEAQALAHASSVRPEPRPGAAYRWR
jgi:hypothetical protein